MDETWWFGYFSIHITIVFVSIPNLRYRWTNFYFLFVLGRIWFYVKLLFEHPIINLKKWMHIHAQIRIKTPENVIISCRLASFLLLRDNVMAVTWNELVWKYINWNEQKKKQKSTSSLSYHKRSKNKVTTGIIRIRQISHIVEFGTP